jgi:hypothetical protein
MTARTTEMTQEKPPALIVERGNDASTLAIAFCGMTHKLGVQPFEFFQVSNLLGYSRILCRDNSQIWYHMGFDEGTPDLPSSAALLRRHIERLSPRKVMSIGTSAGGYAAMVFGHLLGVNEVHAFGPQTFLGLRRLLYPRRFRSFHRLLRLYRCPTATRELFDLKTVLGTHNGATKYFIYYCEGQRWDRYNAERLGGLPGVQLCPYPCYRHGVTRYLVKQGLLMDLLRQDAPGSPGHGHRGEPLLR